MNACHTGAILGTFAKFLKATISLVMYVRPSEWNTERIFTKIYTRAFFENL